MRKMQAEIRRIAALREDELNEAAKELAAPLDLVREVHRLGKLPVVNFAAGGGATHDGAATAVRWRRIWAFAGHPELTSDRRVFAAFLTAVGSVSKSTRYW